MRQLSQAPLHKRKKPLQWLRHGTTQAIMGSVIFASLATAVVYGVQKGHLDQVISQAEARSIEFSAQSGLHLRDVLVEGRINTPLETLQAVVNLQPKQAILDVDPQRLRNRLEALPWVARAHVQRQLPDTVHIRLEEHQPTALWQHDGTFSLINKDGDVILTGGDDIQVYDHLPLVVGKGAPQEANAILGILQAEPALAQDIKAVVRVSQRRWDVIMTNDITIKLPEEAPARAWAQVARYAADFDLFNKKITTVDLRLNDRIFLEIDNLETLLKPNKGQNT